MYSHDATVDDRGMLITSNASLNLGDSPRKLVSVVAEGVPLTDHKEHFQYLTSINVSLTNACNLSCGYCYEQHNKDYGRFTVESLRAAMSFLQTINDLPNKTMIFFGGEPLIHERLILSFLKQHKPNGIALSMVTNGLLLKRSFVDEWLSHPDTSIILSLDSFTEDHRGIKPEQYRVLKSIIQYMAERDANRLTVRPTISLETLPTLRPFLEELTSLGVRKVILQPLIMGNGSGFINWPDDEWTKLLGEIHHFITTHPDCDVEVTEGMGTKTTGRNCLSGYDIISIDPSGDFSGCYFFVNMKESASQLVSGNIFRNVLYRDRELDFDRQYREMLTVHEECQTCDYQDRCYQCPAGNLDTGGTLYRPDGMCKRFVELFLEIQASNWEKRWKRHLSDDPAVVLNTLHQRIFGHDGDIMEAWQVGDYPALQERMKEHFTFRQLPRHVINTYPQLFIAMLGGLLE